MPATIWMPSSVASSASARENGPCNPCACATQSAPSFGVKYDEYSGKTTSSAPRFAASPASREIDLEIGVGVVARRELRDRDRLRFGACHGVSLRRTCQPTEASHTS